MQSRDEVAESVAPEESAQTPTSESLTRYPIGKRIVAVAAAWLVPGAGHALLGRYWRALLFFTLIVGSFFFGLILHGKLFWPTVPEKPGILHFDLISVLFTFAQFGSGLCYFASLALGFGSNPQPEAVTYEYGNTFTFLAGLLNYLVVHDAFDIAAGRKP